MSARTFVKVVKRSIAAIVLSGAALWSADWLILQIREARGGGVDTVTVYRSYAVHLKNKRIEQDVAPVHDEECVRSLFSHDDENPCWFLRRHANDNEELNGNPWRFWSQE